MKQFLLFLFSCCFFFACSKDVVLSDEFFPDDAFRNALGYYFSLSEGDKVPEDILSGVTYLELSGLNIKDLKGVEFFTGLRELYCANNFLTELDLSKNVSLVTVELYGNGLTSLDMSHIPSLQELGCSFNQLTSIDVSRNPELRVLLCNANPLESIDVTQNPLLYKLGVKDCRLKELDVTHNPKLKDLYCSRNKFQELDLTNNPELDNLVYEVPYFGSLKIIRPEGKPDLGKGRTSSWNDSLGNYFVSDFEKAMEKKHRALVGDNKESVFKKVPFDSLDFEKAMGIMEESLEDMKFVHINSFSDTSSFAAFERKWESYPEVVFIPDIHDSLTVSQRIRYYQDQIAFFDESIRIFRQMKRLGIADEEEEEEDLLDISSQIREKLQEELEKMENRNEVME